jgi:tetratricopeptide (TPR) repeat protein
MDLTSIATLVLLVVGVIGADTALHPTSVVLQASVAGKLDKLSIDSNTLDGMLDYEVKKICSAPSLLAAPEIRPSSSTGVGMAIAQALRMQDVALALQAEFGYHPENLKLTLLSENGITKLLVSGGGLGGRIQTPPFQKELVLRQGETIASLVHRGAIAGMTEIDPYTTALFLIQSHVRDDDFTHAETLINQVTAQLPQAPVNFDRSMFENLEGIIALLRGNSDQADKLFHIAAASDPGNPAAALNAAFVDVDLGKYDNAISHVQHVLATDKPLEKTLRATSYLVWAAALAGQNRINAAGPKLAQALQSDPTLAAVYEFWSELKRAKGDTAAAERLHEQAWGEASDGFENYAEIAALYFILPWKPGQPLTRSPFADAGLVRFR